MQKIVHVQMPEGGVVQCVISEKELQTPFKAGEYCICVLDYGQDVGHIVKVTELQPAEELPSFRVLRKQTAEDEAMVKTNMEIAEKARHAFHLSVVHERSHVKVLHVRFSFMRERLFIRYGASAVVDLRRFINQIQRDFKTVVDLWQVGVRDECSFMGCLGHCGRAACCCTWQRQFQNLTTRMAKVQDVPLNPITANGHCGRLKCCLAFECEQYQEAGIGLPESGSLVHCVNEAQDAEGMVVGRDVMRGRLTVRTREGRFLTLTKEDVQLSRISRPDTYSKGEEANEDSVAEWTEP
jgi:cell fate regulator YaaT (PSP1 superfamily)